MEEIKFLSKFLNDMIPTRLSWQSPREKNGFRVFWSAEKASNHTSTYLDNGFSIHDRIKTSLSAFNSYYPTEVLIQFWAASMTEDGRRLLTTSDQPFAINYLKDEKLIQYKKDCPKYKFVGEGEEDHNLTDDAPVSRVFRTQLPELSPDLSYYSVKEYPERERDLALGCGFKATFVLPVSDPTLQCCVGVLELLFTKCIDIVLYHYIYLARRILQAAGLDTVNAKQLRIHIREVHLVSATEELKGAMAHVRETDKSHKEDLHNFLSSILTILKQHLKQFKVVTGDIGNDLFTEIGYLNESNVEADNTSFTYNTLSTSSGHETTNSSREFTSFHTISSLNIYSDYKTISLSGDFTSIKTKAEDSARSLRSRSIESTMNSTRRKFNNYTGPSGNRSYLDQSPSKIKEPVDSETGSSYCIKLFGHVMSANQYQVPTMNERRGDSSVSDAPRSEGSAAVARTIPPWTMVDVEMSKWKLR